MPGPIVVDWSNLDRAINPAFWPLLGCRKRNLVLMGGAGSGKSVFATQKVIFRAMTERGHNIICFRKIAATLKDSAIAEFKNTLRNLGVEDLWTENKTDFSFVCKNGSRVRFMGLDDQEKLKSIARLTSAWLEEATEFVPKDLEQINLRLRGRPAVRDCDGRPGARQLILTFNPISALHWLKRRFFDTRDPRSKTLKTTYRDNAFIDDEYKAELEALAERDPLFAAVYARGEWGVLEGLVYQPWESLDAYPEIQSRVYGLDFGFNHPIALVECGLRDGEVFLVEKVYESGLTTGDLVDRMAELGISKDDPIYADPAEPDRIEEIARAGYNIHPAEKGQGSVSAGIDFLKKTRIYTQPGNENVNAENVTYAWRKNKDGEALDVPEDANDHAMDAVRYAVWTHLGKDAPSEVAGGYDAYPAG